MRDSRSARRNWVLREQIIHATTEAVGRAEALESIYSEALQGLRRAVGADRGSVLVFDPDGVMRFQASYGLSDDYKRKVEGHTPWSRGMRNAVPVLVRDVEEDPSLAAYLEVFRAEGIRALAFIPLMGKEGVLGKFMLYFDQPHEFDQVEIRISQTIAGQAAFATERRQAEIALREANARVTNILDSITESFVALDRDFRFTYVNRRVLEQTGKTREELLGRNVWEVFPEASETDLLPLYRKVMEERVPAQFQLHFRGRWLEVHAHPAPDGLSAYIMDVTERRQAQDAVRESEKRARRQWLELETVYKTAPVGLALADADLRYVRVNEQLAVINGLPVEEHPGKRIRDVATPIAAVVEGLHREVIETGRPIMAREIECPCPAQPNSPRSFLVSLVPLRFDGAVAGVSSAIQDVTEQRSFERQIRQTQKLEAIGVLAGGVAHDFNNLLTGIMGNASLAMEAIAASHPSYEPLTETLRAAERASALTMQLLAYSGKGRFVVETINLSELIREITSLVRSSIPRTVDLQLDLADPIAEINADPAQIQQLILNLVINAAEAVPPEHPGVVRISTSEMELAGSHPGFPNQPPAFGRHVLLEVSDSGVGMDDATKARIFDPFFTTKFTGRGLGLAAALGIVRGHKGMISVESRPGAGSTFRVVLPATGQAERAGPKTAGVSRPQGTGTILVVDDEEVVLRMASAALKRTGYDVLVAHNGEAAVEVFRRAGPVSAVLLDLTMPIMGGEETLRRLRMISPHVKVILSSGFSEMEALRRFQGKGLDGFIQKPYTAATLATKLQQVLLGRGLPAAGAA